MVQVQYTVAVVRQNTEDQNTKKENAKNTTKDQNIVVVHQNTEIEIKNTNIFIVII